MGKQRDEPGANEEPVVTLSAGDTADGPGWRRDPAVPEPIIPRVWRWEAPLGEFSKGSASQSGLEKGISTGLGWFLAGVCGISREIGLSLNVCSSIPGICFPLASEQELVVLCHSGILEWFGWERGLKSHPVLWAGTPPTSPGGSKPRCPRNSGC